MKYYKLTWSCVTWDGLIELFYTPKVWKSIGEMKADVFKFSPELDHFPKSPHRHIWDGVSIHISSAVQRAAEELQRWVQFRSNNFLYV